MVKIVFSDIDGTFLTPDSKVSERTGKAVRSLLAGGIPFVLVSARMPEAIYPITDQLGIQIPIISYSGGLVLSKEGETLASTEMAAADTARLLTVIGTKFPQVTVNYYAGAGSGAGGRDFDEPVAALSACCGSGDLLQWKSG